MAGAIGVVYVAVGEMNGAVVAVGLLLGANTGWCPTGPADLVAAVRGSTERGVRVGSDCDGAAYASGSSDEGAELANAPTTLAIIRQITNQSLMMRVHSPRGYLNLAMPR